jgi:hypothetical protein
MMDSLPWMLDQTDHEQNEEQYSFYQHQNPLTKPTVHSIGMKSQLYSLWKVWYALSLFLKAQVVWIWFFIDIKIKRWFKCSSYNVYSIMSILMVQSYI